MDAPDNPVVIGYVDTGINPYHAAFRAPSWQEHPSTFIPGYPEDAQAVHLTFDAPSLEAALQADEEVWSSLELGRLYYVPGTRIVGAIHFDPFFADRGWFDENGHGTAVASTGSGALGVDPSSAIVMAYNDPREEPWAWLASQAWVDIVSSSRADLLGVGVPPTKLAEGYEVGEAIAASEQAYRRGALVLSAAGNGPPAHNAYNQVDSYAGPPWVFAVGGFKGAGSLQSPFYICEDCARPFQAAGRYDVMAADAASLDAYERRIGTSYAAPSLAGYAARLISVARQLLADPGDSTDGVPARLGDGATAPPSGPAADGVFDVADLSSALRQAARPLAVRVGIPGLEETTPGFVITPAAGSRYEGYGMFADAEHAKADAWLRGEAEMPDRSADDRWHDTFEAAAWAYWGTWMCNWNHGVQGLAPCVVGGLDPPAVRADVLG